MFELVKPSLMFHSIFAIPYGIFLIYGYKNFFKSSNTRVAITFDDIGFAGRLFIYIARENNIRTITFQHSVIDDILRYKDTISDIMCVWGNYPRNLLISYGVPSSKLVVVGPLRNLEKSRSISINVDRILNRKIVIGWFPTKFIDSDMHIFINKKELQCILRGVNSFINRYSDWDVKLIIKIHPQDDKYIYKKIINEIINDLDEKIINKIKILDIPIEKVINKMDLILATNTTSNIESLILGKIIGYINCSGVEETLPLVKYGAAISIKNSNDLFKLLETFTRIDEINKIIYKFEEGRRNFLRDYLNNGKLDYKQILEIIS